VRTEQGVGKKREVISAKVSSESADGWRKFCFDNGVSISALLEVAGLQLAGETFPPTVAERKKMVQMAREVDILRRTRR